eukprot:5899762-Amphidinium_carterae.1
MQPGCKTCRIIATGGTRLESSRLQAVVARFSSQRHCSKEQVCKVFRQEQCIEDGCASPEMYRGRPKASRKKARLCTMAAVKAQPAWTCCCGNNASGRHFRKQGPYYNPNNNH